MDNKQVRNSGDISAASKQVRLLEHRQRCLDEERSLADTDDRPDVSPDERPSTFDPRCRLPIARASSLIIHRLCMDECESWIAGKANAMSGNRIRARHQLGER